MAGKVFEMAFNLTARIGSFVSGMTSSSSALSGLNQRINLTNTALRNLDRAHREGAISAEQHARATAALRQQPQRGSPAGPAVLPPVPRLRCRAAAPARPCSLPLKPPFCTIQQSSAWPSLLPALAWELNLVAVPRPDGSDMLT